MLSSSFKNNSNYYFSLYKNNISSLKTELDKLYQQTASADITQQTQREKLSAAINSSRIKLKACDFWLRYLEPVAYKKINGPLPVEWETEVFEKYEAPYKREGAGLTLAYQYLQTENPSKDSLQKFISASTESLKIYLADSITAQLNTYHHFFLCNRLFILDLATIYTSGFDCPDTGRIIPELYSMMQNTAAIYNTYNQEFQSHTLGNEYLSLYKNAMLFVKNQPKEYEIFDHFVFIRGFTEERKKQVLQQFAAGKTAYLTHCGKCHNKTVNGKEVIPDISFQQADTYKVRFANNKHKSELAEEIITEHELDMIVIFFTYKKESGVKAFDDK